MVELRSDIEVYQTPDAKHTLDRIYLDGRFVGVVDAAPGSSVAMLEPDVPPAAYYSLCRALDQRDQGKYPARLINCFGSVTTASTYGGYDQDERKKPDPGKNKKTV